MPQKGEDAIILTDAVGISEGDPNAGEQAVLYTETLGRVESPVDSGDPVVLTLQELGQGRGQGGVVVSPFEASDRLLYKGDTTTLTATVFNDTPNQVDYEVRFKEDDTVFDSETNTLQRAETEDYQTTRTKNDPGEFRYQANSSNTLKVTWLNVRPGDLTASPNPLDLSAGEETTTLDFSVENPGSTAVDVEVRFFRGETEEIDVFSRTIDPGTTESFSTTETKTEQTKQDYTAQVFEVDTGLSGKTNPITVKWFEDLSAQTVNLDINQHLNTQYFGGGKDWAAGEYEITVEGWYSVWGDPNDVWTCDRHIDPDDKVYVHGPCMVGDIGGGSNVPGTGPYITWGATDAKQSVVFDEKNLSGDFSGEGRGTISLTSPGQIGVYMDDASPDDNIGGLTYRIFPLE